MEKAETIFSALLAGPTGANYFLALGPLFVAVFWGLRKVLAPERKDDRFLAFLAAKAAGFGTTLERLYGGAVDGFLRWIDRRAGDDYLERAMAGGKWTSPWSPGLYDFTLLLAVAYPFIFLFVGWTVNGIPPPGLEVLVRLEPNGMIRAIAAAGVSLIGVLSVKLIRSSGWHRVIYLVLAVAVTGLVARIAAFSLFVASVAVLASVGAATVGFSGASVVAFAISMTFAFAGVGVGAFAGGVVLGITVTWIFGRLEKNRQKNAFLVTHGLGFLVASLAVLAFVDIGDKPRSMLQLLLFLALLPLANAPLDWASLGLTRWLLRLGRVKGTAFWEAAMSVVDVFGALVIMVVLAGVTAAVVSLANTVGPGPVLPLGPLFEGLRNNPADAPNLWIYLMLFSTLLPTAVHLTAALAALVVALIKLVVDAVRGARAFIEADGGPDAAKDNMVRIWYPALGAVGTTGLVFLASLLWWVFPLLAVPFAWFGNLLLDVAEGSDLFVRGLF